MLKTVAKGALEKAKVVGNKWEIMRRTGWKIAKRWKKIGGLLGEIEGNWRENWESCRDKELHKENKGFKKTKMCTKKRQNEGFCKKKKTQYSG